MGLLTDPSTGQGKLTKFLLKYYAKVCGLLYITGVLWFCAMASPSFNAGTYFSENALLPGLVKSMFFEDKTAQRFYEELQVETLKYENSMPYSWLLARFGQIGLDTYSHNFTLNSPLSRNEKFYGKNVYGILRAPRASSTEALVLSVPYRSQSSVHLSTLPSIAAILAFAKYSIKEKYWAKDIIFLITDHEQLGMQAWLEAYHGVSCGNENVLLHGDLKGRSGAIQAAINLELHSNHIGSVDIKIEGLNGQLPNLDLFNLASKICHKEGVFCTFKNKKPEYHRDPYKEWQYYFKNMLTMIATQATGVPNGNHGLFLRFGIQALTLEGFEHNKGTSRAGFLNICRVIEGIFRSMNNLLERFHQSFFFYLLPSSDRYISIGLYIPSACLIAAALIIKACAKWCSMQEKQKLCKTEGLTSNYEINYIKVAIVFILFHLIGAITLTLPEHLRNAAEYYDFKVGGTVFGGLIGIALVTLFSPVFLGSLRSCSGSMDLMCILSLLELGTALICISMNNFSLGIFCGLICVPSALLIDTSENRFYKVFQKIVWILLHPLTVVYVVIYINTYLMFSKTSIQENLFRSIDAFQQAVIYSIVDSVIYGNWLFTVVTTIFSSNWLCFWCVSFGKTLTPNRVNLKKKN